MRTRKIFYKFLSICISLNLAFVSVVVFYYYPVYATSTEDDDSWFETAKSFMRDCVFQICADTGVIVSLAVGDADSCLENFYISNYLKEKTYKDYIQEHFVPHDDGTASIDAELYQFLLDFIQENKDSSFNKSDYIYCYYPDEQQSIYSTTEWGLGWGADFGDTFNPIMSNTPYVWFNANRSIGYTSSNNNFTAVVNFYYLPNDNDLVFIYASSSNGYFLPYHFNSSTKVFTNANFICYSNVFSKSSSVLNKFVSTPVDGYLLDFSSDEITDTFRTFMRTSNSIPFYQSNAYTGSATFPIWISMEKYLEYQVLFEDYQTGCDYVINEDNSITINNYYNGGGGSGTEVKDYTQYLQYILDEIQSVNFSISNLDLNCDHSVMEASLDSMNNHLSDLYALLGVVVTKMDANASDYSDIVDSLDALSAKLDTINNSINNLDYSDVTDRLDSMEGTVDEMKDLISEQNSSISDIKETITNMDGNISEINITIQNLSSSINDQFLSITKNGFKDVVDQLEDLNDNLVALSRALVGKDSFEDALSGVKSNFPDPDDIILASVNELAELQEEALSFGGALGDIFSKLLDFQTGIDDLVQDEEYIDEVEDLLRQLLPKDPEDNEDDSFFDKVLKTIEMSLQLYANSVDEIKETSKKKFPFSIGYDIELLLMLLSAEPQTPVFTIPFEYERINYKTEIIIDFSMFDDAIDVIRFFLTIYYCFFLLMITPKMIGLNNEVDS